MSKSVVVLGGGLIGLTSALLLSADGCDVTLVDSAALGSGAARGNAGFLCPTLLAPLPGPGQLRAAFTGLSDPTRALRVRPQALPSMARWSLGFVRASTAARFERSRAALARFHHAHAEALARIAALGVEAQVGNELLVPFHDVGAAERQHADLTTMIRFGGQPPGPLLDGNAVRAMVPALTDHVNAGFVLPSDRAVDPRRYVETLIDVLLQRGVTAHEHCAVTSVVSSGSRISALRTSAGPLVADEFVLAAGAGVRPLAKLFGLRLAVVPGQGYNVALPVDPRVDRPIIFEEVHAVATPLGDRIRLGGTMEFAGDRPAFDARRVQAIIASLRRFIDLRWDEGFEPWAGSRPMSPDGLPYLGRPKRWSNLVVAAGHGMYGLTLAAPTASAVAHLIADDGSPTDLAAFSPDR